MNIEFQGAERWEGGRGREKEEEEQARVLCAKEESPIAAAKSHDPIANSSMIHSAKNTRRGDRHETITRQTTSVSFSQRSSCKVKELVTTTSTLAMTPSSNDRRDLTRPLASSLACVIKVSWRVTSSLFSSPFFAVKLSRYLVDNASPPELELIENSNHSHVITIFIAGLVQYNDAGACVSLTVVSRNHTVTNITPRCYYNVNQNRLGTSLHACNIF